MINTQTHGLTTNQAKLLWQQFGPNRINTKPNHTLFGKLLAELFGYLNILLIIAAVVAYAVGNAKDSVMIMAIVVLNGSISFWQEYKAEKTLNELKKLSQTYSRVWRDGKEVLLNSDQLVPGDVVILEAGNKVPADGIATDAYNLEINESALTGESSPVYKKAGEAEHNQIYGGTLVSSGTGLMTVSAIGNQTKFGKIAQTLKGIQDMDTPLQTQINRLALTIGLAALIFSVIIFFTGVRLGFDVHQMFLTAVSIAVAAIPEGLPAIILIALAIGVKKMAQQKALVRKMVAIEGLGSVNLIATDKTGTLTRGEMRVSRLFFHNRIYLAKEAKSILKQKFGPKLLDCLVLANDASLFYKFDHGSKDILGDETDGALLIFAQSLEIDYEMQRAQAKILDEFSFDQKLKTMSIVVERNGEVEAFVKASPEAMVTNSTRIAEGEKIKLLNDTDKQHLIEEFQKLSSAGLRVLGLGFKNRLDKQPRYERSDIESDLIFLGFIALADPIREEVKQAIKAAKQAGVETVMITGDNERTAMAIAKELDLAKEGEEVLTGKALSAMSEEELQVTIKKTRIFARVNPEDKLRIVNSYQKAGLSVAVTGDGVNDSLALKQAEIGVAMGKKGTEVAKEASDIVILDDNYATIVAAIAEGRSIYKNVLKAVRYLISTNLSELLAIFLALLAGLPSPLLPIQILWINLVSDGLPAIALAFDPNDHKEMKKLPRARQQKLITTWDMAVLASIGLTVAVLTLFVYIWVLKVGNLELARTWAFTLIILFQMLVAFIIRGYLRPFNYKLLLAVVLTLIIQLIILTTPALHPIFKISKIW